ARNRSRVDRMTSAPNLICPTWANLDSHELRLLLDARVGGPGQYDDRENNPNTLYIPIGRSSCRLILTYDNGRIVAIAPGAAFDSDEWERIRAEFENSVLGGPMKVGRNWSFSSSRVQGFWRGSRSGIQLLPPPTGTPQAPVELAQHPFVFEFPFMETSIPAIRSYRWAREHRRLTLLLNVLLAGRTSLQRQRPKEFWAYVRPATGPAQTLWVQEGFSA